VFKKRLHTSLFLLLAFNQIHGQNIHIDTLRLSFENSFAQNSRAILKFPILKLPNAETSRKINADLIRKFTQEECSENAADSCLLAWAKETITWVNFEVTYLTNELISLNISAEGCGAYCSQGTNYYTYSLLSGKYLNLGDILDTTEKFKKNVLTAKNKQFDAFRQELHSALSDKEHPLDKETFDWAMESYANCENSFDLSTFALYPDHLEILYDCGLPNAIKNLSALICIKYTYKSLKRYLKKID